MTSGHRHRRIRVASTLSLIVALVAGCGGSEVETYYGRIRGQSINGTGTLAEMFRAEGNEVRAAVRLTENLKDWADVIVRFSPHPGPPSSEEAEWYAHWLDDGEGRRLVYVVNDYDAQHDYWTELLAHLPPKTTTADRERVERRQRQSWNWSDHLPHRPKEIANPTDWFAVNTAKGPPAPCKTLDGPWAKSIDPKSAALVRHETFKVDAENVLLKGDDEALVLEWSRYNSSRVLVLANGSFLLNGALLIKGRRPLAERTAEWGCEEGPDLKVAFVEGSDVIGEEVGPSIWNMLRRIWEFRWIAIQMLLLGLAVCLARAARLGRPHPAIPSGADQPVAHPLALGTLMARTRQSRQALAILENYRKWRFPNRQTGDRLQPSDKGTLEATPLGTQAKLPSLEREER